MPLNINYINTYEKHQQIGKDLIFFVHVVVMNHFAIVT